MDNFMFDESMDLTGLDELLLDSQLNDDSMDFTSFDTFVLDAQLNDTSDDSLCRLFEVNIMNDQYDSLCMEVDVSDYERECAEERNSTENLPEHPQIGHGLPIPQPPVNNIIRNDNRNDEIEIEFQILEEGPWKVNRTFHTKTKLLRAKLSHDEEGVINLLQVGEAIDSAYERFVSSMISEAGNNDRIYITFRNSSENRELYIAFKKENFNKEQFLDRAYALAQSAGNFLDNNVFEIKVQVVQCVTGNGRVSKLQPGSIRAYQKRSIVQVFNEDHKCGYMAIGIGKLFLDKIAGTLLEDHVSWKRTRVSPIAQLKAASNLFQDLGVNCLRPLDMNNIVAIQEKLNDYQIIVIDRRTQLKLYAGPEREKVLGLEYSEPPHFNFIKSIKSYMDAVEFCTRCWVKHQKGKHSCSTSCKKCTKITQCPLIALITCSTCHVDFNSDSCFDYHIEKTLCQRKQKCEECWIVYNTQEIHVCDTYKCIKCNVLYKESPHYCHIKVLEIDDLKKDDERPAIMICYDIESMQIPLENNELVHQPNLLISFTICNECVDLQTFGKKDGICKVCGPLENIYRGNDCVTRFCDYLYRDIAPIAYAKKSKVTIIAHNQRGYDGHFIIQDFYKRDFQATPNLIMVGSKILFAGMEQLRFIDSLSLFLQPLSSLSESFNIEELKKGFFPHKFNTPENQEYVGSLPSIENYYPESMKPKQLVEFSSWHQEQANNLFDFGKEIVEYCRSDVQILMISMLKFVKLFSSITGINPITRGFTLASIAMEVFRAKMLLPMSLAVTPTLGYAARKHSVIGSCWLDFQQKKQGQPIPREYRIGNFFADGFIPETKQVFEFWGCYFHGCPVCYPDRSQDVRIGDQSINVQTLYEKVELKRLYYTHRGFKLEEIWEHELDKKDSYIADRIEYYHSLKKVGCIDIKESFFGGRTNNIKFFHKCSENERIRYLDFTSLYPYVLRKNVFPMGHPTVIQEDFKDISEYFGFIKCKVLAPQNINIGVLPLRLDRLLFPLCRTCATKMQQQCDHTDEERYMTNTWTTIELQEALTIGYKIIKIYQVLDYEQSPSSSQFGEYIKMWLKIKQESSGWPSWCQTEADKSKYISDYKIAEDIDLEFENIEKNPGKRSIAKLMLNSFWGKLAQNPNMPKTQVLRSYADLWQIANNPELETLGLFEVNDDTLLIQHKYNDTSLDQVNPGKTNLAVASFVTAYGRLELFRLINKIENHRVGRVLYFDTDSVVFVENENDQEIKCGDYLGELTDEIEPGWKCTDFVTLGPKNYGYEVSDTHGNRKAITKVKGIKLTSAALDILTLQKLMEMIDNYINGIQDVVHINQTNIVSDKFTHIVKTKSFNKIYRAVSEKRKIIGNDTRPYGYIPSS